jgi:hypothetical protein
MVIGVALIGVTGVGSVAGIIGAIITDRGGLDTACDRPTFVLSGLGKGLGVIITHYT